MTNKIFLGSEPINNGERECKFDPLVSDDGQSYTVVVNVSDFTPKEGGRNFAVTLVAALDDITVRLLEDDVEFYCSAGDGFGSGTDIGCYADEDKPLPPGALHTGGERYKTLEVTQLSSRAAHYQQPHFWRQ